MNTSRALELAQAYDENATLRRRLRISTVWHFVLMLTVIGFTVGNLRLEQAHEAQIAELTARHADALELLRSSMVVDRELKVLDARMGETDYTVDLEAITDYCARGWVSSTTPNFRFTCFERPR